MKNLKIKLLYSIIILGLIYIVFSLKSNYFTTKYNSNTKEIIGIVTNYEIDGSLVKLEVNGLEKIIVNYYIKKEQEKENLHIKIGEKYKFKGELTEPGSNRNFNLFNYNKYLKSKKIYWVMQSTTLVKVADNKSVYKIKDNILNKIKKNENGAYLGLFILGDNSLLENKVLENFRKIGISHLFAISGMHITLLSGIILKILKKITKNEKIILIILTIFLLFYMFLTNYSPSVLRASFLFIILFIKKIFNLKFKNINVLLLILFLLLVYNPFYIYNVGFVYSFLVSFTLLVIQNKLNIFKNYFSQIFMTSLISFLISIPISINNFYDINFLTPFFNIIFIPYVSLFLFPLSLISFIFEFLNPVLTLAITILEFLINLFSNCGLFIVSFSKLSNIWFIILYMVIIFVIKQILKRRYKYIFFLVIVLIINYNILFFDNNAYITMIDVGQGDAILISLPHNSGHILIDTGGAIKNNEPWQQKKNPYNLASSTIIPYLKSIGIKKLNYLITTHGDMDHIEYAEYIYNNFKVGQVIINSGDDGYIEKRLLKKIPNIKKMNVGVININDILLKFINEKNASNENEDSLIIHTKIRNKNILLMGDAGNITEKKLLNTYNLENMDILKVGHHGSKYSTSEDFINKIKPTFALVSAGVDNRFNHPHIETINKLNKYKVKIYETNKYGMIKVKINNSITVQTCLFGYANSI